MVPLKQKPPTMLRAVVVPWLFCGPGRDRIVHPFGCLRPNCKFAKVGGPGRDRIVHPFGCLRPNCKFAKVGGPGRDRTCDQAVMSRAL